MKPKFLLAFDRDYKRKFVVHLQHPLLVAEAIQEPNSNIINLEVVRHEDTDLPVEKLAGLMRRMGDWYHSCIVSGASIRQKTAF